MSSHGLPLRGYVVVGLRCLHFTIRALTVDWGRSSRTEIAQTDLWQRWDPMTHSTASVCLSRLQGCVLTFNHLLAIGVPETTDRKRVV